MHELLQGNTLEVAGGQSGVLATPLSRLVLPWWVQHDAMKSQLMVRCSMRQVLDQGAVYCGKIYAYVDQNMHMLLATMRHM